MTPHATYAPGARVLIRDEEWMIRRVQHARAGNALTVVGLSELVRNQEAIFLTELDEVTVLHPEKTKLIRDTSPGHRQARLYLEALLRRTPPTDDRLVVGHRAAVRPSPYQWDPAAKALRQLRPRILMADGVGLGKTIEVGVLLSELIRRGRGQRILVVALKSILAQFQEELWARFTIPLVRLDSVGIQRVQARIPSNQNPFHYFDKVIVSIDTLKKNERYGRFLEDCRWDVVVIDECQNVAARGNKRSRRADLARTLARNSDGLILTSATPHDGRPASFASLMRLLEPTAVADESSFSAEDVGEFFIRRFQKDVRHAVVGQFSERDVATIEPDCTPEEDAALAAIDAARFRTIGKSQSTDALFRSTVLKAWLSSPAACLATLKERRGAVERLGAKGARDPEDVAHDKQLIDGLRRVVEAVSPEKQSKLQALFAFLVERGYAPGRAGERVVIFSERIDTLEFLAEQLKRRFSLKRTPPRRGDLSKWKKQEIALFHGGLPDQEQYALVQDFANRGGQIRLLLGSDAASEGLNLHHACHYMVHYDIPWSLITLEQRNGRIDRFGQDETPVIRYLLAKPGRNELRGDHRILRRLIEKEAEAVKNLGDVAWLMNLHDAQAEEQRIAQAIVDHEDPDAPFQPEEAPASDWFQALMSVDDEATVTETVRPLSLYDEELDYAREGFAQLGMEGQGGGVDWFDELAGFRLRAPEDLLIRYAYLPPELRRGRKGELKLTSDPQRVMDAYDKARDTEDGWPEWELFWEQHPVAEWLNDRVLASFARHEAPLIEVGAGLAPGEAAYIFQSTLSNKRSQPVLVDWAAVRRAPGAAGAALGEPEDFEALSRRCGLDRSVPNSGRALALEPLQADLSRAVDVVLRRLEARRLEYETTAAATLRPAVRKLRRWHAQALDRLGAQQEVLLVQRSDQARRLERERREIKAVYESRDLWIREVILCSPVPYIRLAAVLARPE
jgi:ERCC4-related helicase